MFRRSTNARHPVCDGRPRGLGDVRIGGRGCAAVLQRVADCPLRPGREVCDRAHWWQAVIAGWGGGHVSRLGRVDVVGGCWSCWCGEVVVIVGYAVADVLDPFRRPIAMPSSRWARPIVLPGPAAGRGGAGLRRLRDHRGVRRRSPLHPPGTYLTVLVLAASTPERHGRCRSRWGRRWQPPRRPTGHR